MRWTKWKVGEKFGGKGIDRHARRLALLWQIYSRRAPVPIHFWQCGHRCGGGRRMSSRMAYRTAGNACGSTRMPPRRSSTVSRSIPALMATAERKTQAAKVGPRYARRLRAEMFVSIGGKRMYLWRAVDAEGEVLDILVQARRDQRVAQSLMRKLLRKFGMSPSSVTTDCLPSYAAALSELGLSKKHVRGRRKNNRVESSHVPIRRRERKAQRFRSPGSAQRFLSTHAAVYNTFNTCRHLISANSNRELRRRPSLRGARLSA